MSTEEIGEISTKKVPFMYVEWKFPENLFLSRKAKCRIHSPSFHFKDATWNLRLNITASKAFNCRWKLDDIKLGLVKKEPSTVTLRVDYNIGTKTVFGNTYESYRSEIYSKFEKDSGCCGMFDVLYRWDICKRKNSIISKGIVTFFCYFWVETVVNLDAGPSIKSAISYQYPIEMFKEMDNRLPIENVGKILSETSILVYTEWKVPINNLPVHSDKYTLYSPRFQFKHVTWFLQVTIDDMQVMKRYGIFDLHLVRKECDAPTFHVDYKIGAIEVDGDMHELGSGEDVFDINETCPLLIDPVLREHLKPRDLGHVVTLFGYFRLENSAKLDMIPTTKISEGLQKLGKDFNNLFITGDESDVIIKVKSKEFKVHKCILCARSPVFYSMFTHDMTEKNSGIVDITDCDPDAFQIFLQYLYSGHLENFSTNTVFDLYAAADKYDIGELKLQCKEFMVSSLSVDTVCDVAKHAIQYDEVELLKTATEFFAINLKTVILTVNWQSFLIKNPITANELLVKASNYM